MNAIEIRGLKKHYPDFDLGPLDLTVPQGSIYGFVGPNAAGKTTTIDLMFGMGRADAGSIQICGLDQSTDEVAIKRRAAYVGPELEYTSWGNVGAAIRFVRGFYPDSWDGKYCQELLGHFNLDAEQKIATLSFGSRTRLAILLALSRRPDVLVLDEPTTGLDAIAKQELFQQLLALVQDSEHTILISSHNLADVERFADQLGIINDGVMLHEGPTSEIVERYCLVDFTLINGGDFAPPAGLTLIKRDGDRIRVLADQQSNGIETLRSIGVDGLHESPVTLEDLFVSLLKK
ncbi:MAG: ABC-2 type transport system ATP-binding protein [Verrucomicrobiales bacterium]|jgi:ABC-2 type transport system ATP-binding protein